MTTPLPHPLILAVADPWESITQTIRETDPASFGDPLTPSTPAFHLRHTIEVFRYPARLVIAQLDPPNTDRIPHDEHVPIPAPIHNTPVPWSPHAAFAELQHLTQTFVDWLEHTNPDPATTIIQHSGRTLSLHDFLAMMERHITWHAAAAYYRGRPTPIETPESTHERSWTAPR